MFEKDILCALSGGGFRATFFHAGVLRSLIRLGLKDRIKVVSSVSGGSIVNALFGLNFDNIYTVEDFDRIIIVPLIEFSCQNPRNSIVKHQILSVINKLIAGIGAVVSPVGNPLSFFRTRQNSELFIEQMDEYIFKGKTLKDLSKNIRVVINATNLNNGARFRFDNTDFGDYKMGYSYGVDHMPTSHAVMASACFPGLFTPFKLDLRHHQFYLRDKNKTDSINPNMVPNQVYLSDGGIFDNLGYFSIESELKRGNNGFVLISDAANRFCNTDEPYGLLNSIFRIKDILMEQVSNRDRMKIVDNLLDNKWFGVYFKLENSCRWYRDYKHKKCPDAPILPNFGFSDSVVNRIAQIRTDLNIFSDMEIKCLVYHGETLAETAIAKWHNHDYAALRDSKEYSLLTDLGCSEDKIFNGLNSSHKLF